MRPRALIVLAGILAPALSPAQTRPRTLPANARTGTLVAIDADAATLSLRPKAGPDITYRITEKTRLLRAKKPADLAAFKPGDAIVVRFRRSSVGPATLYDLADKSSWEWLDRIRHDTSVVTVREITDSSLHAAEGNDNAEIEYRVTEKTMWSRAGKPADPEDFKAGERVHVVPRLLPSGSVMAIAVSDAAGSASVLKERTRFSVTGLVKLINVEKRAIAIHTAAGDDRDLTIMPECVVRQNSRDVPLTAVRAGQTVSLRLRRGADGEQEVSRITIQTRSASSSRARAPKSSAARPGVKPLPPPAGGKPGAAAP